MNTSAKKVTVFLGKGDPTGWKVVEVSNWSGKAYVIPRSELSNLLAQNGNDLESPSMYILVGQRESKQQVYIGEAESFAERIKHHQKKYFWHTALCFLSKDKNITKAHVKYLESRILEEVKYAGNVDIKAGQNSRRPKLSEFDIADMDEFIWYIQLVLGTLGYTFLKLYRKNNHTPTNEIWYAQTKGYKAYGLYKKEGFVVLKGSEINKTTSNTIGKLALNKRSDLINRGEIKEKQDGTYVFQNDIVFPTPSNAASVVLGRSSNGWTEWKNEDGYTLDSVKRKNVSTENSS